MSDNMISFDAYVAKAYELTAAAKADANAPTGVGVFEGRVVAFGNDFPGAVDAAAVKRNFVESAVAKFGEKFRADFERIVNGEGAALSARTILQVDRFAQGAEATVNRLAAIMNRAAAKSSALKVGTAEIEKLFEGYDLSDERAAAFAAMKADLLAAAGNAEKKLATLLSLKAEVLSNAFGANPDLPVKKAFEAAIDAQADLAGKLRSFNSRTRGQIPGAADLALRADSRGTELLAVTADLSAMKAAGTRGASLAELLARKTLAMHGNTDIISRIDDNLAPLLARVTAVKVSMAEGGGAAECAEAAVVLAELDAAKAEFLKLGAEGVKSGEGAWFADKDLIESTVKVLGEAADDLRTVSEPAAGKVLKNYAEALFTDSFFGQKLFSVDEEGTLGKIRNLALAWAGNPTEKALAELTRACNKAAKATPNPGPEKFLLKLPKRLSQMNELLAKGKTSKAFKTDKMLSLLFDRKLDVKNAMFAMALDLTDDMIDIDINDADLVEKKSLGDGSSNKTYLCTYKTASGKPKTYVFKPGIPADATFGGFCASAEGYREVESTAHLNAAACKIAQALGTPNAVVGVKTGCVNGEFGIMMELAGGASLEDVADNKNNISLGLASWKKVHRLSNPAFEKLSVNFMRGAIDLEWNDWLSGQSDRHWGNYLAKIDDRQNVEIRGIDNDLSFPAWRLGIMRFKVEGKYAEIFLSKLKQAHLPGGSSIKSLAKAYAKNPAFTFAPDGKSFTVDVENAPELAAVVHLTFGVHNIAKPAAIGEDMYNRLREMDKNREELRKALAPHIGEEAIEATFSRLDDMLQHAEELKKKGRVMKDADWDDANLVKAIADDQIPADQKGLPLDEIPTYRLDFYQRDFVQVYN